MFDFVARVERSETREPTFIARRSLDSYCPSKALRRGGDMMRIRWKIPALLVLAALFAAAPPVVRGHAASGPEISANVNATLNRFFGETPYGRELANKALAVLVFPSIIKAGFGIGGEYGEGDLQIRGRPAGYYNIASASFGFQLGAQARTVIIMFMTEGALGQFQSTDGFKIGVD